LEVEMAFDFLGTFNLSQIQQFLTFARSQLPAIGARINHLEAEISRIGSIVFEFEQGTPSAFGADPPESYLGRLLAAYEVLGGNPFSLRLRSRNQPSFLVRGTENSPAQYMSTGEVVGAKGLADAPSAVLVDNARRWIDATLQRRFGRLERKIRRALDYSDQLQLEINGLELIRQGAEQEGSLEGIASQLQQLISDPNYRAIYDDAGQDPYGFNVYAPFSSYDAVVSSSPDQVNRTAETAQRQSGGFVGPGGKAAK
jgi:hypothetical protein